MDRRPLTERDLRRAIARALGSPRFTITRGQRDHIVSRARRPSPAAPDPFAMPRWLVAIIAMNLLGVLACLVAWVIVMFRLAAATGG